MERKCCYLRLCSVMFKIYLSLRTDIKWPMNDVLIFLLKVEEDLAVLVMHSTLSCIAWGDRCQLHTHSWISSYESFKWSKWQTSTFKCLMVQDFYLKASKCLKYFHKGANSFCRHYSLTNSQTAGGLVNGKAVCICQNGNKTHSSKETVRCGHVTLVLKD